MTLSITFNEWSKNKGLQTTSCDSHSTDAYAVFTAPVMNEERHL